MDRKNLPSRDRRGTENPRRGVRGERGLAPYFRSKVSIGAEARTRVGKADAFFRKSEPWGASQ
jgi:hypothetical protein